MDNAPLDVKATITDWLAVHHRLMQHYFFRRSIDSDAVTERTIHAAKEETRLRDLTRTLAVAAEARGIDSSPYHLLLGNVPLDPMLQPTGDLFDQAHALTKRLEAVLASEGTATRVLAPSTPPSEARYTFRRKGGVFEVRYGDEEGTFSANMLGAKFAYEMIQHPNVQYEPIKLRQAVGGIDADHRETSQDNGEADRQLAVDSLKKCKESIAEVDAEIEEAKGMGSEGLQERAERKRAEILQEVKRLSGLGQQGHQRSSGDKHRVAVANAIKTLRECCERNNMPQFAAHLKRIDTGTSCAYRPAAPAPDWRF